MSQLRVGLVGWRGMVGSVLMQRMIDENDFEGITPVFSLPVMPVAMPHPKWHCPLASFEDAHDLAALAACDAIITCQGGDYTKEVHQPLRDKGWTGYWIDAASTPAYD